MQKLDQIMDEMKSIEDVYKKIQASWAAEDERSARLAAKSVRENRSAIRAAKREREVRSARRAAKRERQATALGAPIKGWSS
jgi:hypothetical protein